MHFFSFLGHLFVLQKGKDYKVLQKKKGCDAYAAYDMLPNIERLKRMSNVLIPQKRWYIGK